MKIHFRNEQNLLSISENSTVDAVNFFLDKEKVDCDELSIYLIDDEKIANLHHHYFQDSSPTDCISFPIDAPGEREDGTCFLGEIFVSTETALSYATAHNIDPCQEVLLYIIHGLLHLIGYNDEV